MSPLNDGQVEAYLARIAAARPTIADPGALDTLQLCHLRSVPFENLDIHRSVRIVTDPAMVFDKVVTRRRGGYCYELNGLFGALLDALGYEVTVVSARVARSDGSFGPEFDHLALLVRPHGGERASLVDVGFGDAFDTPLPLIHGAEHRHEGKNVRLVEHDHEWRYEEDDGDGWKPQYVFTLQPRSLAEFEAMNDWQQTSPDSHFTQGTVCSLATSDGRITLAGSRLIERRGDQRTERELVPAEIDAVLQAGFGIVLDPGT